MESESNVELTASEVSDLWTAYQADSMAICGIKYFLTHIDNDDIREVLEYVFQFCIESKLPFIRNNELDF